MHGKRQEAVPVGPSVAADSQELTSVVAVAAILLLVHLYNLRMVPQGPKPASALASAASPSWVGKYATHAGSVVGEVVAVTESSLVLRQGTIHKAVPLAQAAQIDGQIVLSGAIDWDAAASAGDEWLKGRMGA